MKEEQWKPCTPYGAYENLGFAIVERAVQDYGNALRRFKHARAKEEKTATLVVIGGFERFFRSDWCYQLTQGRLAGDVIISKMKEKILGEKFKNLDLKALQD